MAKRNAVTMQDVAALAGVSKQTVSAVLNGKPGISAETEARVRRAVESLGYRLDKVARSLRTGRTGAVALIVSDTASPFIGKVVVAAEDYARISGYSLVVYNTHDNVEREVIYFDAAVERRVDGVVFIAARDECPGLNLLQAQGIPAVAIDRIPEPYTGPSVALDNARAGSLAAEHLLALGHTDFAHISGPQLVRMSRDRLLGFRQVLEGHGLAALAVETGDGWDYPNGYAAMQRLLAAGQRFTALFAAGDVLAIGAMRALRETGLRIPEDVSVVGVDDIDGAGYQNPPLTTVRQSKAELARLGFQLLFDLIDGKQPSQTGIVMEPVLVVRESTASHSSEGTTTGARAPTTAA